MQCNTNKGQYFAGNSRILCLLTMFFTNWNGCYVVFMLEPALVNFSTEMPLITSNVSVLPVGSSAVNVTLQRTSAGRGVQERLNATSRRGLSPARLIST